MEDRLCDAPALRGPEDVGEDRRGYVYFIRCLTTEFVRIGWSLDSPDTRFAVTQVYSPTPLKRIAVMRGTQYDEAKLHLRFRALRHHAEWFRPSEAIDAFIAEHTEKWVAGAIGAMTDEESAYWMTGLGPAFPERKPFVRRPRKTKR